MYKLTHKDDKNYVQYEADTAKEMALFIGNFLNIPQNWNVKIDGIDKLFNADYFARNYNKLQSR